MENTQIPASELRYAIMINGQPVGPKYASMQIAEAQIALLSEAHQSIAEIVPVTVDGNQLLFG